MAVVLTEQPPPPAPITDRPLSAIDLLDGAFAVLRQRPRPIVTVIAGLVAPLALVEGWLVRNSFGGASLGEIVGDPTLANEVGATGSFSTTAITYLLDWFVTAVAGVAISSIIGGWLDGRDITATQAARFTLRRLPTIAVAFVLIHIAEVIGTVLLIVPGVIALLWFSLTSPVIAFEGLGPVASMKRSASLARRRIGSVIGVVILTGLVSYGVSNAVEVLPAVVALALGPDRTWPLISVASILSSLILVPFVTAAMCLLYLDIRYRTEGLDIELRRRQRSGVPVSSALRSAAPTDTTAPRGPGQQW